MTNLVYYKLHDMPGCTAADDELLGRTLTTDEYANITAQELLDAINHCGWGIDGHIELTHDRRFTQEVRDKLNAMSADQLKKFIEENGGMIIRTDEPLFRNVFPVFKKGPRKGQPNFKSKQAETFWDRYYLIENKHACVVREEVEAHKSHAQN